MKPHVLFLHSASVFILLFIAPLAAVSQETGVEEEIDQINQQIRLHGLQWEAGPTALSGLSEIEKINRLGAFVPLREDPSRMIELQTIAELPSAWDWTDHDGGNYITSIKDQGNCGSCWAFATIGVMEAMYNIENNLYSTEFKQTVFGMADDSRRNILRYPAGADALQLRELKYPDFSEQFLISCSTAGDCDGGYEDDAWAHLKKQGVVPEECYPYLAQTTACAPCADWRKQLTRVKNWGYVTQSNVRMNAIKTALLDGPLVMYMEVYSDFYHYRSGIYQPVKSASFEGGHAVVLVGYNEQQDYWICKNSWGTNWGEEGYFRIRFGECETGSWVSQAWNVSSENQPPEMVFITDKLVKEGQELDFIITATDPDDDRLTFFASPIPQGAEFSQDGRFIWTPTYTQSGWYTIRISVTDGLSEISQKVDINVINVKKGKGKF